MSSTEALRSLAIKTNVSKRLLKDCEYSAKEVSSEKDRLSKLSDEYEIRAQEKVVKDAEQMIPHYREQLEESLKDLLECSVR